MIRNGLGMMGDYGYTLKAKRRCVERLENRNSILKGLRNKFKNSLFAFPVFFYLRS